MKRSLSILAALVLAAAPAMAQQHPMHPGVSADSMAAMMNGVWEGPFTIDQGGAGTMSITVAHDSTGVKATMTITGHGDIPSTALANIKHDGGKISWTQETAGFQCAGSASHAADGALAGTLDCGHAVLSFNLTKSPSPKAK